MNFDRFDDQDQLGIETIVKHLEACMV